MSYQTSIYSINTSPWINRYVDLSPPHIYNSHKNMFDLSNTYFTLKEVKFMREKIVIIFLFNTEDYEN